MKACAKKKLTKKEAQEHLNHLLKKGHFKNGRIYACNECVGVWHITHTAIADKEERTIKEVDLSFKDKWTELLKY